MITHLKTELKPLTPELAHEFAEMQAWRGERPLSDARMAFLISKISNRLFHPPRWAVATCNGERYRMNGQHSSAALQCSNGDFPQGLDVIIDEFACETEADIAELFGQFDALASARNIDNIVNAHARLHAELDEIPTSVVSACVAGIKLALSQGQTTRTPMEERARIVHEWKDFILAAANPMRSRTLRRPGIVAAMMVTWVRNAEEALKFWRAVAAEDEAPEQPSRLLAKVLREAQLQTNKTRWSQADYYYKCVLAWNAFRQGRTPTQLSSRRAVAAI